MSKLKSGDILGHTRNDTVISLVVGTAEVGGIEAIAHLDTSPGWVPDSPHLSRIGAMGNYHHITEDATWMRGELLRRLEAQESEAFEGRKGLLAAVEDKTAEIRDITSYIALINEQKESA